MFTLGSRADEGADKKKVQSTQQKAEDRMADTLAMKDSKRDAKRERDNYAVKLRKEKR